MSGPKAFSQGVRINGDDLYKIQEVFPLNFSHQDIF